jgi:2-keto-4-pentenoate hydratase/2-oxohepta-3-ene-1,7-dioic acid hydratase in catechol pathway
MRIARLLDGEQTVLGVVQDGRVRRLRGYEKLRDAFADDPDRVLEAADDDAKPLEEVKLLAPVDDRARVFAIAQNYPLHAKEVSDANAPSAPVMFTKLANSMISPGENVIIPTLTEFLDYEAEMAAVVGQRGRDLTADDARAAVWGVTCLNDVSARDLQWATLGGKEIVDWFSGKCLDRTTPVGPWIASMDEVGDPNDLAVRCRLNGEEVQSDRTSSMVFTTEQIISYISHRVELLPGDIVATGTPAGVGRYRGRRLEDGDVVEVEVEGVGVLRTQFVAHQSKE